MTQRYLLSCQFLYVGQIDADTLSLERALLSVNVPQNIRLLSPSNRQSALLPWPTIALRRIGGRLGRSEFFLKR